MAGMALSLEADDIGNGVDSNVLAAIQAAIQLKSTYNIRVMNLSLGRPIFESYCQRSALPGGRSCLEGGNYSCTPARNAA